MLETLVEGKTGEGARSVPCSHAGRTSWFDESRITEGTKGTPDARAVAANAAQNNPAEIDFIVDSRNSTGLAAGRNLRL